MNEHLIEVDLLDEDLKRSGNYQEFDYTNIQAESFSKLALRIDDKWIPKSCLRLDGYDNLWISCSFYANVF